MVAAYETLKDPAKRQIYDLSQGNPHFSSETSYSEDYQYRGESQTGQKYYENKWYNYSKSEQENLRDEYHRASLKYQENFIRTNIIYRISFVILMFVGLDFIKYRREQKHLEFRKLQKDVLDKQQFEESPLVIVEREEDQVKIQNLQEYIKVRYSENRVV